MTRLVHCCRCGSVFVPTHPIERLGWRRLCPRCREPLPPTSSSVVECWTESRTAAAIAAMGGTA